MYITYCYYFVAQSQHEVGNDQTVHQDRQDSVHTDQPTGMLILSIVTDYMSSYCQVFNIFKYAYKRDYLLNHTYVHTYMHTYIHTYMHTCIHTYMRACMHFSNIPCHFAKNLVFSPSLHAC